MLWKIKTKLGDSYTTKRFDSLEISNNDRFLGLRVSILVKGYFVRRGMIVNSTCKSSLF
jgi:hypothetical protein